METIIASLISAGAAIVVCVISSGAQHRKMMAELDKRDALQAYRIEQLEKKVDKHNNVIERTYALEKRADLFEEKFKVAGHRIDDLEEGRKTHEIKR